MARIVAPSLRATRTRRTTRAPRRNPATPDNPIGPWTRRPSDALRDALKGVGACFKNNDFPLRKSWVGCRELIDMLWVGVVAAHLPEPAIVSALSESFRYIGDERRWTRAMMQRYETRRDMLFNALSHGVVENDRSGRDGVTREVIKQELDAPLPDPDDGAFSFTDARSERERENLAMLRSMGQLLRVLLGDRPRAIYRAIDVFVPERDISDVLVIIRDLLPWWMVASFLSLRGEDLGEPLWYSVIANHLPADPREAAAVAEQVGDHAEQIEDLARSIAKQGGGWQRVREAYLDDAAVAYDPFLPFIEPYL